MNYEDCKVGQTVVTNRIVQAWGQTLFAKGEAGVIRALTADQLAVSKRGMVNSVMMHPSEVDLKGEDSSGTSTDDEQWKRRYNYLLAFLVEKGVITNQRYSNGTWVLRGVYGIDDSGLMGAGRTPEEAIDNAITMSAMSAKDAEAFRQRIHKDIQ